MNTVEFMTLGYYATKAVFSTISTLTVSVDATLNTMTRSAGSWITDGIEVGQRVTTTGFASAGNNGTFEVSAVTATVITLIDATDPVSGLVDVTDDTGVSVHIGDLRIVNGPALLGRLRVLTATDNVTPYDDDSAIWDVVTDAAELEIGTTPLRANTSLRVVCTTPAEAWVFYKVV
jgi:hypothetical protein